MNSGLLRQCFNSLCFFGSVKLAAARDFWKWQKPRSWEGHPKNHGWGGDPPCGPGMGRGVGPCSKNEVRGGRGYPPSPPCGQQAPFLHNKNLYFEWSLRRRRGVCVIGGLSSGCPAGPEGEGGPLLLRDVGGRYPHLEKEMRGGGDTPLPLWVYGNFLLGEKPFAGRCVTLITPADWC